jgi:hypothetical protein
MTRRRTVEGDLRAQAKLADKLAPGGRTCEVCGRFALSRHPCRFAVACSCWRGVACDGSGKVKR